MAINTGWLPCALHSVATCLGATLRGVYTIGNIWLALLLVRVSALLVTENGVHIVTQLEGGVFSAVSGFGLLHHCSDAAGNLDLTCPRAAALRLGDENVSHRELGMDLIWQLNQTALDRVQRSLDAHLAVLLSPEDPGAKMEA